MISLTKEKYIMTKPEKKEFYKELFGLAIPIGLQSLLIALIGATDALMLGRLSQDAVSAVSLANQIAFVMNLFIGAIVGGGGFGKAVDTCYEAHPLANIVWAPIGSIFALVDYLVGIVLCVTIIGIPFAKQCFKLARLTLLPFGALVADAQ